MVGPEEDMSWAAAGFDSEMHADIAQAMRHESDVFLFGRVTYEIFAAYLPAPKADLLRRLGRDAEAADAYRAALALTDNAAEQKFLAARVTSTQPAA